MNKVKKPIAPLKSAYEKLAEGNLESFSCHPTLTEEWKHLRRLRQRKSTTKGDDLPHVFVNFEDWSQ